MKKSLLFCPALFFCFAFTSVAQVYYPPPVPQAPPSNRPAGLVMADIKKLENQVRELERAIYYERTGSMPSQALIQSYEQQIILIRQQIVRLNIEYANARP